MTEPIAIQTGTTTPRIILGCWQLSQGHSAMSQSKESLFSAFDHAIDLGLTTFDCADIYTGVEDLLGEFIHRHRTRHGSAGADRIRIHTKFVPDLNQLRTLCAADVRRAVERSRKRLGVDQVDLVQFAWWDYEVQRYVEVASWLVDLQNEGFIKALGATNFDTYRLRHLLDANMPVTVHQVQYSLIDRRPAASMTTLCASRGIWMACYGTLCGGLLSERYLRADQPTEPFENRSIRKYMLMIEEFGGWGLFQELLGALENVATRHQCHIPTVAARYVLDQPMVGAVILGMRSAAHLEHTREILALSLRPEDLGEIDAVVTRARGPGGEVFQLERDRHGPHGRIMKYDLQQN